MALVVFLRGVNVGGHRSLRPAALGQQLRHLDAVNIGAAGTLVVRGKVGRATLRAEIGRRLSFACEIVICDGREILRLVSHDIFAGHRARRDLVQFVSVLSRRPRAVSRLPLFLPSRTRWLLHATGCEGRFVYGRHRRQMKAIGCLQQLDRIFGVRVTTRSWSTILAVARWLEGGGSAPV